VFPGGRVDETDADLEGGDWCDGLDHAARQLPDLPRPDAVAFHVAAVRELFEEAGVLVARRGSGGFVSLADSGSHRRFMAHRAAVHARSRTLRAIAEIESLRVALDALLLFAHWVTPPLPVEGRRFDTRFFVTRVPDGQVPAHDDRETTDGVWMTPREAIARAFNREIVLPPPTWVTLRELERHSTVNDALAWAAARRVVRREPAVVEEDGSRILVMPLDDGPAPIRYERRFALRGGAWGPIEERTP
jgi:8-oxo-dGTP pyrophosphatase MutT (NUDIX family)